MKAITVKQPWAWPIALGAKTVENRTLPHPWRSAVGERIAVHAGKGWDTSAVHDQRLIEAAKAAGHLFAVEELDPACYEYGVVLATVRLTDVHRGDRPCRCRGHNDWAEPGAWHLVLRDVTRLRTPVPCRGYQGLWTLPADVERDVLAATAVPA